MSPLALRRFRAERLLRRDFDGLRSTVLASVRGRLAGSGVRLDAADLEECYAQAWQGLYATMLGGQEVLNPTGWLIQVTFRRAIEEARATRACSHGDGWEATLATAEPDPAQRLDDRARLRHVFEALRMRLRGRECEAATLCYLQGLSRAQAATRMGISEARMHKLMDGAGPDKPGVAAKVNTLIGTIRAGGWCDEQASLMRGLAFGLLAPGGERHALAVAHQRACPACRAYVATLRGLASALPPLALPASIGAAGAAAGAGGAAAGGGWLLAGGPLSAKLAVGCAIALSVGAGCVAVTVAPSHLHALRERSHHHHRGLVRAGAEAVLLRPGTLMLQQAPVSGAGTPVPGASPGSPVPSATRAPRPSARAAAAALGGASKAQREFGPERGATTTASGDGSGSGSMPGRGAPGTPPSPTPATAPVAVQAGGTRLAPAPRPSASPRARHEFGFE